MTAILEPETTETAPRAVVVPPPAAPPAAPAPQRAVREVRTRPVLSAKAVRLVGAALVVLYAIGVAVQPAPDGPEPVAPLYANVLNGVITFGLLGVLAGIISGRRWSVGVGLVTGGSLLTLSAMCPASGHHAIAAWWFVQMAVGVAMTVLPAAVLHRTRGQSR